MENERRGGGTEAIGAGQAAKYMFLHTCCVHIHLLSLRQTVGCIGEELEKKGSGVCVCVCMCRREREWERGDYFRAVKLSQLAGGEQKAVSWCRRLSSWQTLQFGAFSGVSGCGSHISRHG